MPNHFNVFSKLVRRGPKFTRFEVADALDADWYVVLVDNARLDAGKTVGELMNQLADEAARPRPGHQFGTERNWTLREAVKYCSGVDQYRCGLRVTRKPISR